MKHPMDELLQHLYGILQEFKAVEAEMEAEGGPQQDPEGFERLWKKLTNKE